MTCTKRVSEAEKITRRWIREAQETVERMTGVWPDEDDIIMQLCDAEWIFCGGFAEDEEEIIDMVSMLKQLSVIVERTIEEIRADQEYFDIDGIEPSEV